MRLALALVLAIIATAHDAGASAQKAAPEVRTLSGEWTFSAEVLFHESLGAAVRLATFDKRLWDAARRAGFEPWPEKLAC